MTDPLVPKTAAQTISTRAWRNAIFAVFSLAGAAFATWASRIPAVKHDLGITTAGVAVLLFGIAIGSIVGLAGAPAVLAKFGARRGLLLSVCSFGVGLAVAGVGVALHSALLTFLGLTYFGFSYSTTDVLMNVEGADVEKAVGKTLMPLLHAFFSIGTILGAALGAAAAAVRLPVVWNFTLMSLLVLAVISVAIRSIPVVDPAATIDHDSRWLRLRANLAVWKDLRLIGIGVMVLGITFAEGSANDWLTLASVDGHGYSPTVGALVYGTFVAAMTAGRVSGGPLIDRYGRVRLLAGSVALGVSGVLLFILSPAPWATFGGAALWGLGGSLGFPVGMSAAADHPTQAARRVSIVAIFGYAAFLIGPPVLGVLGQRFGILTALYVVTGLLVLSLLASPSAAQDSARHAARP